MNECERAMTYRAVNFLLWMIVFVLCTFMFFVYGCASIAEKPVITGITVAPTVKELSPVLCVEPKDLPASVRASSCTPGMDDLQKTICLGIDRRALEVYAEKAEGLLIGCTKALPKEK